VTPACSTRHERTSIGNGRLGNVSTDISAATAATFDQACAEFGEAVAGFCKTRRRARLTTQVDVRPYPRLMPSARL
jgi:hypothetical protein